MMQQYKRSVAIGVVVLLVAISGCSAISPLPEPTSDTSAEGPADTDGTPVTVTRVIDGDTVEIEFTDGREDTVRLLGVDTPETTYSSVSPGEFEGISETTAGRDHLFEWGKEASTFARQELHGKEVWFVADEQADRRGSYGRLLGYLYVGGENFNQRLIAEGYARVYDSQFSQRAAFDRAESQAQTDNIGLWDFGDSEGSSNETVQDESQSGTTNTGSTALGLTLGDVVKDAPGNDNQNLNGEYITLTNTGAETLDLSVWIVEDAAGNAYTIPRGTELPAGEELRIYSGSGVDNSTALYWGSSRAIWNNGGDTAIIRDGTGEITLEKEI